jgi:hypothetical protein
MLQNNANLASSYQSEININALYCMSFSHKGLEVPCWFRMVYIFSGWLSTLSHLDKKAKGGYLDDDDQDEEDDYGNLMPEEYEN